MSEKKLTVPINHDRNKTILGQRGDTLQWFTILGWAAVPVKYEEDPKTKRKVKIPNDGWIQVDPAKFDPAPAPLKTTEVETSTKKKS